MTSPCLNPQSLEHRPSWPKQQKQQLTLALSSVHQRQSIWLWIATLSQPFKSMEIRAVASLTVPDGQEFHFPHFFLKFRSIFLTFPQTFLVFFLILALRVGESPTWEGPGYATDGDPINHVSDFRYLGSMVASGSSDLKRRKSLAWCAFWKLEQLWKSPHISITTKVKFFNTTCVTILLYGCESWVISQDMENKINAFATSCYRVMLNIKRYSMTNTVPLIHLVRHRQLKFLGHILRMSKEEPARRYALYIPTIGKRRPGRPRTSYLNYVQILLGHNEGAMQEQQIAASADDRRAWRNLVVACSAADEWWWSNFNEIALKSTFFEMFIFSALFVNWW